MTVAAQLFAIFAFGLVITGVVFLGIVRAREFSERAARVDDSSPRRANQS